MCNQSRFLNDILSRKKVVFYGIGNQFRECIKEFEGQMEIYLFDSYKFGTMQGKYLIYSPEELNKYYRHGDAVVISSIKNQYEIARSLVDRYGVAREDLFSYTSKDYEEKIYRQDIISENKSKIKEAYSLLADHASKEYWENSLMMRITRQPLYIKPNENAVVTGEYKNVLELEKGDIIIDCGAYIGDTAENYIRRLLGDCFIYAIEPFGDSFAKLEENIKKNNWKSVKAYHCAVGGSEGKTELHYSEDDFKMGITVGKVAGSCTEEVEVQTLDKLFGELPKIDYIKMDIEGQEVPALRGAAEILKHKAPKLMISGYHKLSDFWEIPLLVKEMNPKYKIYVGHAPGVSTEVEYYCKV